MDSTLTRRLRGDGLRVLLHLLDGGAADFVIERLGFVVEVFAVRLINDAGGKVGSRLGCGGGRCRLLQRRFVSF